MYFQSTDEGPFYYSDTEKESQCFNQNLGGSIPLGKHMQLVDLQALAQSHSIEITKQKILPGWEGKAKGILQILWECGLIVESNYKLMTLDGQKNQVTGQIDESTSLCAMLGKCTDFQNELSALQVLGNDLGVAVDFMPKYHAELAGKGIAYSWGLAKGEYHQTLLSQKRQEQLHLTCRKML